MDARNTPKQHLVVGIFSLILIGILRFGLDIRWSTTLARVSFILLFLTVIIGPIMRIRKPHKPCSPLDVPWCWRGELGIWFFITALAHLIFVLLRSSLNELISIGGSGYALTNLIGLVALIISALLTITSSGKLITFLGTENWKWLHSLTYTIFYLVCAHLAYFQFFSTYGTPGPDWFGWLAIALTAIAIILQVISFIVVVKKSKV